MAPSILDLSLGAVEVGVLLTSVLYGIALVQTYTYATYCQGDRIWIKALVAATWAVSTFDMVAAWMYLYYLTVTNFGNLIALVKVPWVLAVAITFHAVGGALVQAFYIWRVYLLSHKRWWPIVVPTVAIVTKVVASIMCTVLISRAGNVRRFQDLYSYAVYLGLVSSAVADIWNTSILCLCLQLRRTDHTRNIVKWTMIWAVETGLVTSVVTILVAVFWGVFPDNALWLALISLDPHLYHNSLLVSLNHRSKIDSASTSMRPPTSIPGPLTFNQSPSHQFDRSTAQDSLSIPDKSGNR